MITTISFVLILSFFLLVGLASARKATGSRKDYYLASSSVKPWLAGLSAVATNNSGYMFIGVIGFTYQTGLAAIWLMIGWIVGDFIGSAFVHRRLRQVTAATGEASFASVIAPLAWRDLRRLAAHRGGHHGDLPDCLCWCADFCRWQSTGRRAGN